MAVLIRDTTIVTCDAGRRVLYGATIAIDGERIAALGPTEQIVARYRNAEQIDGRGKAVFPGFINCHTHLTATLSRGILEDLAFPTILRYPQAPASLLSVEEIQVMALLGAVEGIRSGTTTFFELGTGVASYAEPLANTGARFVLGEMVRDVTYNVIQAGSPLRSAQDFSPKLADEGFQKAIDLFDSWHGKAGGRVSVYFSPATTDSCSPAVLRRSRDLAEKRGVGYTIHLSQSHQEVESVTKVWAMRPAHYLDAHEFLGPRLVAAHCRYLDAAEIGTLGSHRSGVSNNAAIAARRGAAAPVRELQEHGCLIGMGSDNMAEDMVEVMRTGLFMERVRLNDELWPQPEDALEWATAGGARIMGLAQTTGSLEVGKQADLFVIDTRRAHLAPVLRIASDFVHNGMASDVETVMVAGQFLMRNGKVLTVDEADLVLRAEKIAHRAWRQLREKYPDTPFPYLLPEGPTF